MFVGVRLGGLFLLVSAALMPPSLIQLGSMSVEGIALPPVHFFMSALVPPVVNVLLGAGLFLGAPTIERWLARRDACANDDGLAT